MSTPAPAQPITVLVIDDEAPIRRFLRATLEARDYAIVEASTGKEGARLAASRQPDLVLLDLNLPDGDGIAVVKQIREWSRLPIVVLSARGGERDKVLALDAGADDYITKPFGVGELAARVRVALRHAQGGDHDEPVAEIGELKIDFARRHVLVAGRSVRLTPTEFELLRVLARNAGKVCTHGQLLREVWGTERASQTHYIRIYMRQLRNKLETTPAQPRYLLTELGVGYRMAES
jgi:two-component system KDP operon response regulator KdpE